MTVAGKAQVWGQSRQIIVLRDLIQGTRKTQPQVKAIQGHPLDLAEDLR